MVFRQAGLLHELPVLLGVDQLQQVDARMKLVREAERGDLGIDEVRAVGAGQRNAVMTVADEVEVARLVNGDRRQRPVTKRFAQRADSLAQVTPVARPEYAVEVHRSVDRADDAVDRDGPHANVVLTHDAEAIRY